nr:hypothetical protein [Mycoplasma mycoides]
MVIIIFLKFHIKNGAKNFNFCSFAKKLPKWLITVWNNGHTNPIPTEIGNTIIITINGTNLAPLKNDNACGNLLKL